MFFKIQTMQKIDPANLNEKQICWVRVLLKSVDAIILNILADLRLTMLFQKKRALEVQQGFFGTRDLPLFVTG